MKNQCLRQRLSRREAHKSPIRSEERLPRRTDLSIVPSLLQEILWPSLGPSSFPLLFLRLPQLDQTDERLLSHL